MSFKIVMAYIENVQTFEAISKHLEMEEDCMRAYASSNVPFISNGSGPKGNRPYHRKKPKKGRPPPKNSHSKGAFAKKHKAKGKNIEHVKCYKCGKKGHFAQDCPKPTKVLISPKTPKLLFVLIHLLLTLFLNGL